MILLDDIKGQGDAIRYLKGSIASGRISRSYLFSGPEGVGRAMTAKAFLMTLMKIERVDHPDIKWIIPEKNKSIKIEDIRKVKDVLNLKPFQADITVCVIEKAHMMTREASNALLKVLEEPPGRSMLILLSSKKELLLETVISRCSEVRFRPLCLSDTKDIIMTDLPEIDGDSAAFLAYFSQGSPGRAIEISSEGLMDRKSDIVELMEEIVDSDNASCLNWDVEDKDSIMEDIEMLIMFFRDIAVGKEGLDDLIIDKGITDTASYRYFMGCPVWKIFSIVENLIKMKRSLAGNVNPKLVAQVLPGLLI